MISKLQFLKLPEEHETWLKEVYWNYNNHLEVDERRELIVKLVNKLSKNFNPSLIDDRIYHYYNGMGDNRFDYLTLFGIWHINPVDEVFKNIEKIIISVKNLIEENSKITEVSTKDIVDRIKSDGGSLDESEVKKALFLMKDLYSLFTINSYKMNDNEPYSVIQFNNEFSLQPFLYFININTLMEESFEKQSILRQNIGLNQLNITSLQGNDEIIYGTDEVDYNLKNKIEEDTQLDEEKFEIGKYDISSYPADYTMTSIMDLYNKKKIELPEFQRNYIWGKDKIKQSRLIESFLLGLPVPQIFLFQKKETKSLLIIDGFQRLETLKLFYDNILSLKGLSSTWNNQKYKDLSPDDQQRIDMSTLRAIIIRQNAPQDEYSSMYHIFERLNTGGIILSSMEIRKAISYGKLFKALVKLNNDENWKKIIGLSSNDARLRDVEWILRCFALYEAQDKYKSPMKEFLNGFMSENKNKEFPILIKKFQEVFDLTVNSIGERPFHIPHNRLNIGAMETFLVIIAMNLEKIKNISIKLFYDAIFKNQEFINNIARRDTSKTEVLNERFEIAERVLNAITN